jgi:predicted TIM-barrel fold metal-dependent hydrolase
MKRIDVHAHVLPEAYRAIAPAQTDRAAAPLPPGTEQGLFDFMERYAIDAAVISTGPPGATADDPGLARELAQVANEEIARIVRTNHDRLAGLAIVPLPDVDASLEEIAHALDSLGLDGVALFSNVGGTYLGDPSWDALFDELERRSAYVFVHPVAPAQPSPLAWPSWLVEFPFDTTRAIVNLVYSGTLERCPRLRVQVGHLGGAAPFLAHRIASLAERLPDLADRAPRGALEYLGRLYYDTALSNNSVALASTVAAASIDRVVFGTDWPYAALPERGDPAPLLGLDAEQRALVDGVNACALVPRFARATA